MEEAEEDALEWQIEAAWNFAERWMAAENSPKAERRARPAKLWSHHRHRTTGHEAAPRAPVQRTWNAKAAQEPPDNLSRLQRSIDELERKIAAASVVLTEAERRAVQRRAGKQREDAQRRRSRAERSSTIRPGPADVSKTRALSTWAFGSKSGSAGIESRGSRWARLNRCAKMPRA